jgi:hypothetical protein
VVENAADGYCYAGEQQGIGAAAWYETPVDVFCKSRKHIGI